MELLLTGIIPSKVKIDDGGRSKSKRPKQSNDCSVRATALAFNLPYDEVYDVYSSLGRKCATGTPRDISFKVWDILCKKYNRKVIKHSFPAQKGKERMYVAAFCVLHSNGNYITNQAGHHAAVIDGYLHDINVTAYGLQRCIYNAFQII